MKDFYQFSIQGVNFAAGHTQKYKLVGKVALQCLPHSCQLGEHLELLYLGHVLSDISGIKLESSVT
jgi:hypothetical protein